MKEVVTKVIDTLTQEDFDGAFQKLLERYNNCIAAGGDYFEGDKSFLCVLSIKVPIRKKSGNLFDYPRIIVNFSVQVQNNDCSIAFYGCAYKAYPTWTPVPAIEQQAIHSIEFCYSYIHDSLSLVPN